MIACVLATGSKGNSTYIASANANILVDLGTTSLYVEKQLKSMNVDPKLIEGIILTHTHVDHINGLRVFIKKYHPTIYLTQKMLHDLIPIIPDFKYQIIENEFDIKDIHLTIFKTSHDASDSNGYIIESNHRSIVYITDTGYINQKNHSLLQNKNLYIMESNHDVKMLMNGHYPYQIKQRILGDKGHLSNVDSSFYLSKFIGNDTKTVVLIHLSHDNNDPSLALKTLKDELNNKNVSFNNILISSQTERTDVIEV